MSKTKIGSNAQFTSAGKGLTIIGNHCYAYSEQKVFNNTAVTLLEFNTGNKYSKVHFLPYRSDTDSLDSQHYVYFNSILVMVLNMASGQSKNLQEHPMIIPPLTHVEVTIKNVSNTSNGNGACSLTGRLYG